MRLKSLELHGFKSFPEKTVLTFDAGATVIVGPNGSGKSNITDAMRWVLGELSSKNIRGSKMEDVIFMGAEGYRPMGFAEVSVTFDNTEAENRLDTSYDEITVTRRYYRTGESEYFINRKSVRLRDIYELFMNTGIGREGYSIIGQGRISEIVSKKSEERRSVFEETAGIAKYRFKKQEAQKKLDAAEANMLRVADILSELEARVAPLERQSRKAREYLELFGQKKEVDVALWLYDMQNTQDDLKKTQENCAISRHELEMIQDTEDQLQAQSERLFSVSQDNKQESARLYEEIRAVTERNHAAENAYRLLENDVAHAEAELAACDAADRLIEQNLASVRCRMEEAQTQYRNVEQQLQQEENAAAQKKKEQEAVSQQLQEKEQYLRDTLTEQKQHEDALVDLRVRRSVLANTLESQNDRSSGLHDDIRKYELELETITSTHNDVTESCAGYQTEIDKGIQEQHDLEKQLSLARQKELASSRDYSAAEAEIQALDSRISALKNMMEHFDGYNTSVRFVMKEAGKHTLHGVCGPVSHLISVQPEYTVALETALGASLQNIVVESEEAAKSAIEALKHSGTGRATFYPITSMKASARNRETEAAADYQGFIGFADTLVTTKEQYRGVMDSLLNRIAVFDTLDHATVMARSQRWRVRAVTLDGQQINAGGSFTGGTVRRDSGMLTRNAQIENLSAQRFAATQKQQKISQSLSLLRTEIETLQGQLTAALDREKMLRALLLADRAQLDECTARMDVLVNLTAQLREDLEKLHEMGKRGDGDIRALEEEIQQETAETERIAALRRRADTERTLLGEQLDEQNQAMAQYRIRIAELRKDQEAQTLQKNHAAEETARFRQEQEENQHRRAEITKTIADMHTRMEEKSRDTQSFTDSLSALEQKRVSLDGEGVEHERKLNEIRLRLKDVGAKKELLIAANSRNESKQQQLCDEIDKMTHRLWDEYELTPSSAAELSYPAVEVGTRVAFSARLSELKEKIKALGHVNVAAIEEYTEVKERYDFVSVQMQDLETSKKELLDVIGSIEGEMVRMFTDAFTRINECFGEVFRELFGGGEAHLSLSDPDHVLTSGIEISAAPPGKMIKNLSLLSGGEQAVIAIALLFALVRVNPSPFCIFDEIEAALDEVNVQRVAHYIKKISRNMQIIMITHRRGTMEIADALYGVTMPRRGVSRVFALEDAADREQAISGMDEKK